MKVALEIHGVTVTIDAPDDAPPATQLVAQALQTVVLNAIHEAQRVRLQTLSTQTQAVIDDLIRENRELRAAIAAVPPSTPDA